MNEEFKPFPKISRLSRPCIITEKIDGTNASITITEDGRFLTGSRNQWITPERDNFGFSTWANAHKDELMTLGVGTHFGEWWGQGIQRGYGLSEKRFSLFNVRRWCLNGHTPKQITQQDPRVVKVQDILPECVGLVPVLGEEMFDDMGRIRFALDCLRLNGSAAAPGFLNPEGIVIYHIQGGIMFKKTIHKDEEHKG